MSALLYNFKGSWILRADYPCDDPANVWTFVALGSALMFARRKGIRVVR